MPAAAPAVGGTEAQAAERSARRWSWPKRALFRFVFAYLVLYNFPFPLAYLPGTDQLSAWYRQAWYRLVPWVGKHLLHLRQDITVFPNGSGDTTYNYVEVLCFAAIAAVATVMWSILGARQQQHARLHHLLRIYVRYALAVIMLGYGLAKILPPRQFQPAGFDKLVEPFGEFSPMGLLWTFMGYSVAYTIFAGLAEALGGALLLWRRTATVGAIVTAGVMANVVMLNFCYDTPVKLYSSHLLFMACFLIAADLRRLAGVLNFATRPVALHPERRWLRWTLFPAKLAFLGWIGYATASGHAEMAALYDQPRPALQGIYEVEEFARNGAVVPPLLTEATRWRSVIITRYGAFVIRRMDESKRATACKNIWTRTESTWSPARTAAASALSRWRGSISSTSPSTASSRTMSCRCCSTGSTSRSS
ncbi:MAG: hypothetical protein U1E76_05890 [Planctomycetota bacterium]